MRYYEVHPYRSDGYLFVPMVGHYSVAFDSGGGYSCEFTPDASFWERWRADKEGMRNSGFRPSKNEWGEWRVRWEHDVHEAAQKNGTLETREAWEMES